MAGNSSVQLSKCRQARHKTHEHELPVDDSYEDWPRIILQNETTTDLNRRGNLEKAAKHFVVTIPCSYVQRRGPILQAGQTLQKTKPPKRPSCRNLNQTPRQRPRRRSWIPELASLAPVISSAQTKGALGLDCERGYGCLPCRNTLTFTSVPIDLS